MTPREDLASYNDTVPPSTLPFSSAEFTRRLGAVRAAAAERGIDLIVVNKPENIYYLTGYQTLGYFAFQVLLVPAEGGPRFVIRYGERSNVFGRSWLRGVSTYGDSDDPVAVAQAEIERFGPRTIGFESDSWFLTPRQMRAISDANKDRRVEDASDIVDRVRSVKSAEEIAYVVAAARVASIGMRTAIGAVRLGGCDRDIAAAVLDATVRAGGEYPPLPPLISVGAETTLFHTTWSGNRIREGDAVFMEIPGVVGRYLAPIARSAVVGRPPAYVLERYAIARESLEAGIAALRPGASCGEAFEAFAAPCRRAGYEIPIKVGYAVGIGFPPRWSEYSGLNLLPGNNAVLQPGMVFHTPRTVRVDGDQTTIISETTLITQTGNRVLTDVPRELVRL